MTDNPFQPPQTAPIPAKQTAPDELKRPNLARSFVTWATVVTIAALPSFLWGLSLVGGEQVTAMLLGIACFIAIYTALDQTQLAARMRNTPNLRLALRIGYGTRIAVSILFPVGMFIDLFTGMVSVSCVGGVQASLDQGMQELDRSFIFTFATTMLQGFLANCVLGTYTGLVFLIIHLARGGNYPAQPSAESEILPEDDTLRPTDGEASGGDTTGQNPGRA